MPVRLRFFQYRYERPAHSDHSALLHLSSQLLSIYPLKLPNSSSSPAAPGQPEDHAAESVSPVQASKDDHGSKIVDRGSRILDEEVPSSDSANAPAQCTSSTDLPPLRSGHASQASLSSTPLPTATAFRSLITDHSAAGNGSSYGQILRSSSIIGGATGINYVIGMVLLKSDEAIYSCAHS
jgi:hypothetical protein